MAVLTTSNGNPVDDNQHSITAGPNGPILLSDFHLIDKLSHFDRERIPERVVHAKGAGAHGFFEVTNSKFARSICRSKFLERDGKRTPVLVRFSTVGGEKGSADTERDPRGFAVKFYTEEGNWDMVGNNTPVFFIRDPIKFPDFIHTQKRNPQSNLKDPDAFWDFLSLVPESIHQVSILFSDRGTPNGYRFMNGYSSHTLKVVNEKGKASFVKWHFKTDQGIRNFTAEEAGKLAGADPDWATRDLFEAIKRREYPTWTVYVQVMTEEESRAPGNREILQDVTKVWPHGRFPLQPLGRLVLNRNPDNYFAEIEQVAFSPSHMIPGIEASADKMLQGRLFSYPDTHRHRLGPNYQQIPVNQARCARTFHQQRDGFMAVSGVALSSAPNYEPNSTGSGDLSVSTLKAARESQPVLEGNAVIGRHAVALTEADFVQAGRLYEIQSPPAKTRMVSNIVGHLRAAKPFIRARQIAHFKRANKELGHRIEQGILSLTSNRL